MNIIKVLKDKFDNSSVVMKASFAFMVCSFMQRGISVITTPIFTRLLNKEQYGYYTVFNSWLEIISVFTTLKLAGSVFMQALVKFQDSKDELTASTAGLGTTISLTLFVIYIPLHTWVNRLLDMNTLIMSCIFLASWATLMFEIWADRQRNEYKYKAIVLITIFTSLLKPVLGIIAVLSTQNYKAEARILSLVFVEVIAYCGLFVSFLRKGKFYNKKFWKYSLSLNIPLIPHYLTRMILNQSDRLMIKSMVGLGEAGIYGLAHNLAWMLTLVTTAILNTITPWLFHRIKDEEYNKIGKISYSILAIVAFFGLGIILVAPEIVKLFSPKEYYDAIWVIPPLVLSVFFLFMYSLFACFEYYYEKTSFLMVASTIGGIINIVLNYFFIKRFGFIAAGYTTLFCYILYSIMHYVFMRRIQNRKMNNVKVYNPLVIILMSGAFVVTAAIMMLTYKMILIRYSIIIVSLLVIYFKRKTIIEVLKEVRNKN